jgi:predicted dehydrogenase
MRRPLRVGVVSTARIGIEKVIPAMQSSPLCEVVAISSRTGGEAERAAEMLGIPRAHGSYEALTADPEVEAVYNPLPNHLHAEWSIAAARAGKHVLCEKPLACDAEEAQSIVAACDSAGVVLMEAFMYRLHSSWQAALALVREGRIGPVRAVHSRFAYFNDDLTNIRNVRAFGGGALLDIGCYCVSLSRLVFGEEPRVAGASIVWDEASGTDVLTSATLEFPSGHAVFGCSTRAEPDQRVQIWGERGRIDIEIPFNIPKDVPTRITLYSGGDPPTAPGSEELVFAPEDQYEAMADAFARAVAGEAPAPITPGDSVANMRVIDAIFAAAQSAPA